MQLLIYIMQLDPEDYKNSPQAIQNKSSFIEQIKSEQKAEEAPQSPEPIRKWEEKERDKLINELKSEIWHEEEKQKMP